MRHIERVSQVAGGRIVETGKYFTFEVDYTTAGGVKKTLAMPHHVADQVMKAILGEVEFMEPETRKRSFFASFKRNR